MSGWDSYDRQMNRGPISAIAVNWRIAIFVLILVGVTTCGVTVVTKPFQVVGNNLDSDNVQYNYEWFKSQHESIKALDVQITQTDAQLKRFMKDAGPRNKWHREDREEYSRLDAILLGLKNERASQAAQYNARSRMVNRAIFKGTDTPSEIANTAQ